MPTTKYYDDNLSFLSSEQWTRQPQHFPGTINSTVPSGQASSGSNSSDCEFSTPEAFCESSNSPLRSPDTTTTEDAMALQKPYLQMVEPPVESIRFRYPSEMKGTHGSIFGISSITKKEHARRRTFPSVKIVNYSQQPDKKLIIRCTLTTADDNIQHRIPHVHLLKGKAITRFSQEKYVEIDDPIDIEVTSPHYQAVFGNLTILFIKKNAQLKELIKKKKRHLSKMFSTPQQTMILTENDELNLLESAEREIEAMTVNRLNTACLKFEALEAVKGQLHYNSICPPIYSKPIKNIKNSQFNDLRICRIDKVAGTCLGRVEVFIFVDKVNRKDIKVRFFELDEREEEEVWHADAEMNEDDVHFQYAIAFRTPRYRNISITENVKVYFQLERLSNGGRSAPVVFEYTPDPNRWRDEIRKRPRRDSPPIPATVAQWDLPRSTSASVSVTAPQICSSPSMSTGSEGSSSVNMLCNENSWNLEDILKDFPMDDFFPTMDVEPQGDTSVPSAHSSVNDVLSNIPSGDSDVIKKIINSGAISDWARCNGVTENEVEHIRSGVTTSEDVPMPCYHDEYVIDGVNSSQKTSIIEHQGPFTTRFEMCTGDSPKKSLARTNIRPYSSETENFQRDPSVMLQKKLTLATLASEESGMSNRLTRNNIVSKVVKALSGILDLKKCGKIKESNMKRYLQGMFGTCVGDNNDRVLHVLASNQHFPPEMLRFLGVLKLYNIAETVLNLKNNEGQTALHVAVEKSSLQTIAVLVDFGADVNARDVHLNTPVHLVANRAQQDVCHAVGHLLQRNTDLTIYNEDGLTPLHLFVIKKKVEAISRLIVKSENFDSPINVLNLPERKQGNTALHLAVQNKCVDIVGLLLNFGDRLVDVNAKNYEGKTPLAYVSCEDSKIEELLLKNKADPRTKQKLDELKNEDNEGTEDEVQEFEDVDESLSSYAQEWKAAEELKLMDKQTISPFCQVLDEGKTWVHLYGSLASTYPLEFQDGFLRQLETRWSPTLYLLKFVAKKLPKVTKETLRDILMDINADTRIAAQYIDDSVLLKMGVF